MITKVQSWIYVSAAVGAIVFWIVTMYGIPPRVEKLEVQVSENTRKLAEDRVKLDLILGSVTRMESFILQRHGGGQ